MAMMQTTMFWVVLGLGLLLLEVFTQAFVMFFFGLAALVVACLHAFGIQEIYLDWGLFAGLGASGLLFFRRRILASFKNQVAQKVDGITQASVMIEQSIASHARGTVVHLGVPWTAQNLSDEPLVAGEEAVVERVDGVTLMLRKK